MKEKLAYEAGKKTIPINDEVGIIKRFRAFRPRDKNSLIRLIQISG